MDRRIRSVAIMSSAGDVLAESSRSITKAKEPVDATGHATLYWTMASLELLSDEGSAGGEGFAVIRRDGEYVLAVPFDDKAAIVVTRTNLPPKATAARIKLGARRPVGIRRFGWAGAAAAIYYAVFGVFLASLLLDSFGIVLAEPVYLLVTVLGIAFLSLAAVDAKMLRAVADGAPHGRWALLTSAGLKVAISIVLALLGGFLLLLAALGIALSGVLFGLSRTKDVRTYFGL